MQKYIKYLKQRIYCNIRQKKQISISISSIMLLKIWKRIEIRSLLTSKLIFHFLHYYSRTKM